MTTTTDIENLTPRKLIAILDALTDEQKDYPMIVEGCEYPATHIEIVPNDQQKLVEMNY